MSKCRSVLTIVAVLWVLSLEFQQIFAACQCMCRAVSGLPSSVDVDDTGNCDRDFSYTFKVHFATNDDNCGTGLSGYAVVYPNSGASDNMQLHTISPSSFTISGDGHTQSFTVNGQLVDEDVDGISAVSVYESSASCNVDPQVTIIHDDTHCP
jgi:hypothetical protein